MWPSFPPLWQSLQLLPLHPQLLARQQRLEAQLLLQRP